jgi:hypothetical protein
MIRGAIARHTGGGRATDAVSALAAPASSQQHHCSHGTLPLEPTGDGECVIEPSVRCDHCGYCRSLGH